MSNSTDTETVKFYTTPTPYQSYRVVVSKNILNCPDTVYFLNFLSVWGGIDKRTDNIVSWEFSEKLHTDYILKALSKSNAQEVQPLELKW